EEFGRVVSRFAVDFDEPGEVRCGGGGPGVVREPGIRLGEEEHAPPGGEYSSKTWTGTPARGRVPALPSVDDRARTGPCRRRRAPRRRRAALRIAWPPRPGRQGAPRTRAPPRGRPPATHARSTGPDTPCRPGGTPAAGHRHAGRG